MEVEISANPTEQMRRCEALLARAYQEPDEKKRLQLVLTVLANLDVVKRAWPDDTAAITDAALTQADVAVEFNMPRNAIEALETVPQTQRGSIAVERRLGRAFDMLHDDVAAEKHLLAAERILQKSRVHYADATDVLDTLAFHYVRTGRPREAIKRLLRAAALEGQEPVHAATLALQALKTATAAGLRDNESRDEAKSIVRDVENHVKKARAKRQDRASADAIAAIEQDLARLRVGF